MEGYLFRSWDEGAVPCLQYYFVYTYQYLLILSKRHRQIWWNCKAGSCWCLKMLICYNFVFSISCLLLLAIKKAENQRTDAFELVLEKTLESPLDCKEIKSVNPKGNQSWIFMGRPDGEAEAPKLKPPDAKNWLIGKDPDVGEDWRWEEVGTRLREWDGWMASPTQWTWVWASSGSCWWTGKPDVFQSMGL